MNTAIYSHSFVKIVALSLRSIFYFWSLVNLLPGARRGDNR